MEFSNNQAPSNSERKEKMPNAEEEKLALAIMTSARNDFDSQRFTPTTRLNMAAKKLGYENYFNDPKLANVRPIVSSHAAEARKSYKKFHEGKELPLSQEERWMSELLQNENMQHFLHPEDDAELLKKISSQ